MSIAQSIRFELSNRVAQHPNIALSQHIDEAVESAERSARWSEREAAAAARYGEDDGREQEARRDEQRLTMLVWLARLPGNEQAAFMAARRGRRA